MMEKKEWPKRGEMVLGTVVRVNPFSALVSLEEYKNKEGMIHISEVAGKWVRDIRKFVKQNQKVVVLVLGVDEKSGHINLSLKRVRKYDAEKKMKEYKKELKAEKMMKLVAKDLNMNLEEAFNTIGLQLKETFGDIFDVFQISMTEEGFKTLLKKGIPENWANSIRKIAQEQMEVKEITLKGILEIKSYKPDGINDIRKILLESKEKNGIEIKYISSPKYMVSLKTKEPKTGEKKLIRVGEEIIKNIKSLSGEGSFKVG